MFSNRLGIFASLALAASAVLIPPSMSVEEMGDDQSLETLAIDPFKRTVALECPGCDFAVMKGDSLKWETGMGNTFLLGFDISPHEDSLNIDGVRLFPPVLGGFGETFSVTQIDPTSETSLRLRITSYTYRLDGAETVSEDGNELLPLRFQIRAIEEKYVDLPELTINLLKDPEGRLMITSFEASQADQLPAEHEEKDCNEWPLFCQWKAIIADRLEKLKQMGKGCHKRPHGKFESNPMEKEGFEGKPPHRFRPGHEHVHHMGPHGHGHHGHDRMHVFLRRAFFTILVPILIGIFAGTLTYLIGMAIGCLIAMTIAKIRGQDYQRIALEDGDETANEAYDDGIVDVDEDAEGRGEKAEYQELPAYEAPPQYEEDTLKEVKADDK